MVGQHRLDHDLRTVAERLHDRLCFDQRNQRICALCICLQRGLAQTRVRRDGHHGEALCGDRSNDLFTRLKTVEATVFFGNEVDRVDFLNGKCFARCVFGGFRGFLGVRRTIGTHRATGIHQTILRDVATLCDFVVVKVVCARDLHRARAKGHVRVFVGDDRDQAALFFRTNRDFAELAHDRRIAFVIRVNRYRAIAQHGFRAGRRDRDVIAFLAKGDIPVLVFFDVGVGLATRQRVFEVPHVAVGFDVLNFEVGNRGLKMRVPVHQTLAAVDEALVVHFDKDFDHGVVEVALFASRGIRSTRHGERVARPVAGRTQTFQLADDGVAVLAFPFPNLVEECLTAQITTTRLTRRGEHLFDLKLGRDPCVVLTRLPERVKAAHTVPTDQNILQRVVERMAHVQCARHVRRRDHDGKGFVARFVRASRKCACVFPLFVNAGLGFGRVKGLFHRHLYDPFWSCPVD